MTGSGDPWLWWALGPDIGGSLAQAVRIFQGKAAWGGQPAQVVKAAPALRSTASEAVALDGLKLAAEALGLQVVVDARVLKGTIYLGLEKGGDPHAL